MGDCGPSGPPGALSVEKSRYSEARTSAPAVAAATCIGGFICHLAALLDRKMVGIEPTSQCRTDTKACQPLMALRWQHSGIIGIQTEWAIPL
jgi:hypothetical protein